MTENKKTKPPPSLLEGELSSLQDFFAYNSYVRRKYFNFIRTLPEATLAKDRGASFPSILDIWTHILDVAKSWLHAYETGEDTPALKGLSLSDLAELEGEVDEYIEDFMQKLKPENLRKPFEYTNPSGSKVRISSVQDMLYHMIEEELQHRGELNALLWQENIDPPITDWLDWKKSLEGEEE